MTTKFTKDMPPISIQVEISVPVEALPSEAVLPMIDANGHTQAQPDVTLRFPAGLDGDTFVNVQLKGRSFRRFMMQLAEMKVPPAKVTITGRLAGNRLEAAGLKPLDYNHERYVA